MQYAEILAGTVGREKTDGSIGGRIRRTDSRTAGFPRMTPVA